MLGGEFEHFQSLGSFEKVSFVLGSELWENKCHSTLDRVSYILDVWELGFMAIILALNSHSLRLRLGSVRVSLVEGGGGVVVRQTLVLVCVPQVGSTTVAMYFLCTGCLLSSCSAHSSGCVVNGSSAMSAS